MPDIDRVPADDAGHTAGDAYHADDSHAEAAVDDELLYDLSDLFRIFADTTRVKILYALLDRELRVSDLAQLVGVSQSAISHQLRTLRQARLVKFRRDGQNMFYSLCDNHVTTILAAGMSHLCE